MTINSQTKIIAHRGFSSIAPENTLIAFSKAIDSGADYFELDVHKTKNDSIVVIHDSSVDKTSFSKKGYVANMTYQELVDVRVGYPDKFSDKYKDEKIPTLRESLMLAKGKIKVCIEIKVDGIEEGVLKIINDLEMNEEVIIFSFSYPVISKIRELDKNIQILYLKGYADKNTLEYAKMINSNAIGVGSKTTITKDFMDLAHSYGIEVWKYTVDDEEKMQYLIDLKLDGLITNYPNKAIKKIKSIN